MLSRAKNVYTRIRPVKLLYRDS